MVAQRSRRDPLHTHIHTIARAHTLYIYMCIYIRYIKSWNLHAHWICMYKYIYIYIYIYSQSHLRWHFRKLKAQSSNVSFATFQWKETFELWALSFDLETAFEIVTPSGIGCIYKQLNPGIRNSESGSPTVCENSKGQLVWGGYE